MQRKGNIYLLYSDRENTQLRVSNKKKKVLIKSQLKSKPYLFNWLIEKQKRSKNDRKYLLIIDNFYYGYSSI